MQSVVWKKSAGFALPETLIAIGLTIVLTLGSAAIMADFYRKNSMMSRKSEMMDATVPLRNLLQRKTSMMVVDADGNQMSMCKSMLVLKANPVTAVTNSSPIPIELNTDMQVNGQTLVLKDEALVPGNPPFMISKIYIDDLEQIDKTATTSSFVGTVFIEGMASADMEAKETAMGRRAISTTALQVTTATGALLNCNMNSTLGGSEETCSSIEGMVWNPETASCDTGAYRDMATGEFNCPPATVKRASDGVCVPQQQNCNGNSIATGFSMGQVVCVTVPAPSYLVGSGVDGIQPVVPIGSTPAPKSSPTQSVTLTNPTQTVTVPAPNGSTPPSQCVSTTSLGEVTYQACMEQYSQLGDEGVAISGNLNCADLGQTSIYSADAATCSAEVTRDYSTPQVGTNPPSLQPATTTSCRCDGHMIANGEYCVFCVQGVDVGWGFVDYSYGVSQCVNGNLVHVNNVQPTDVDLTSTTCSGGYKRGTKTDGKYRQVP